MEQSLDTRYFICHNLIGLTNNSKEKGCEFMLTTSFFGVTTLTFWGLSFIVKKDNSVFIENICKLIGTICCVIGVTIELLEFMG